MGFGGKRNIFLNIRPSATQKEISRLNFDMLNLRFLQKEKSDSLCTNLEFRGKLEIYNWKYLRD